jgi:prophage regulatory protein
MSDRILLRKQVCVIVGRSATSLWRDVRAGTFPPPRQISSGRVGWLASEVDAWIKSRPIASSAGERSHEVKT